MMIFIHSHFTCSSMLLLPLLLLPFLGGGSNAFIPFQGLRHNTHKPTLLLFASSSSSSSSSKTTSKKIKARVIAAQALIEYPSKSKTKSKTNNHNNNYNPVTKLESHPHFSSLSQRDKAFTRNIISTTTRRKGQIHKILSIVCDKYPPKCGAKYTGIVMSCLQMGVTQILFMDGVKNFAAVKETVNVLKYHDYQTP